MTQLSGTVEKGWGYEIIWATTDKYCGKILVFEKKGSKFSMHFHKDKDETWFVNNGKFMLNWIDTRATTASCFGGNSTSRKFNSFVLFLILMILNLRSALY